MLYYALVFFIIALAARVEIPIFGRSKIYPLSGRHADEKGFIWQDRG